MKLPRELERLRPWLEEQRPYKNVSLEQALEADTSVFVNPARAMSESGFQDALALLASAIREGKVTVRRRTLKDRLAHGRPEPEDPPVRWPVAAR